MNILNKLTKQDIQTKYLNKPILVKCEDTEEWYIVSDVNTSMPLHMLTSEESNLYRQNKSNIKGIQLNGTGDTGYLMWIYFNQVDGWEAFGYE